MDPQDLYFLLFAVGVAAIGLWLTFRKAGSMVGDELPARPAGPAPGKPAADSIAPTHPSESRPVDWTRPSSPPGAVLRKLGEDEGEDVADPTKVGRIAHSAGDESIAIVPVFVDREASMPTSAKVAVTVDAAFRMTKGKRERHEDVFATLPGHTYVLADGVGGHKGGAVAARTAINAFEATCKSGKFSPVEVLSPVPVQATEIVAAVREAHEAVRAKAATDSELAQMSSTFIAIRVETAIGRCYVANVGDSRCYRLREGELKQISTDHTHQERQVGGKVKKVLSRAVGAGGKGIKVDLTLGVAKPGDVYLLCSDGLYNEIPNADIRDTLVSASDVQTAAAKLIELAEERGARDNISVILVGVKAS